MQWKGTVTMGVPGVDREAGASPLAALGVVATKAEVLGGIFQGVPLGVGQGHPEALHGLCRGAPLCQNHLGSALGHLIPCRWTIRIVKMLGGVITNAT